MNFTKRQIEIIDASKDLIGEKGVQNLTIKNLANKMSFSEPALLSSF
ncbi:MAG: TetR family transcriptional regulator [Flavobacteriales bacterium]|nr:TetR family transcriptional regulator [Flavobacteriales bacterium]